jgi:hypothetical protein
MPQKLMGVTTFDTLPPHTVSSEAQAYVCEGFRYRDYVWERRVSTWPTVFSPPSKGIPCRNTAGSEPALPIPIRGLLGRAGIRLARLTRVGSEERHLRIWQLRVRRM